MPALKRTLRTLILIEILFCILLTVAFFCEAHFLAPELMEWQHEQYRKPESTFDKIIGYLDLPFVACLIVSWVGLWRMWRPAFFLYPGYWIASLVVIPFRGSAVTDPFTNVLLDLSALTGGMIISLLLFTPLREEFLSRKKPETGD